MDYDYDLFVIGGGSGGVRAARVAAESGAKVALAEEYRVGGTCVIRGCVPKKIMVFASGGSGAAADAAAFGWDVSLGAFDWPKFRTALHAELDRLESVYQRNLDRSGVETFGQRAVLKNSNAVTLADGGEFTARHILLATGGRPFVPRFPGAEHVWTSEDVFLMQHLPKSVLIVGGGYIACEFAGIFNGLGVKTTQIYRGEQLLRGFDDEARDVVANAMIKRGIDVRLHTDIASVEKTDEGLLAHMQHGEAETFDAIVYATGRIPNTEGLNLERAGVRVGPHGQIEVDNFSQTSVASVYAVGDVTHRINLTPVAIREGQAFADTVFNNKPTNADHVLVASAVFSQPEYGMIGVTEEQARSAGSIEVYTAKFRPMQYSFIDKDEQVLFKLIVSTGSRRILGAHIVAPNAGELIQMVAVAIKMGATKEDFDRVVAVHPTMSEEIVLMKQPVRTA
ncbi:MAG: glutathione-disulfide reductase [Paracoccaceae bacterium]|nr:glutathione-disulfide reductase [Paracoccaceae bacterium]